MTDNFVLTRVVQTEEGDVGIDVPEEFFTHFDWVHGEILRWEFKENEVVITKTKLIVPDQDTGE